MQAKSSFCTRVFRKPFQQTFAWQKLKMTHPEGKRFFSDTIYNEENLSKQELFGEFMFMGLRKSSGANLKEARERFGIDVLERFTSEMEPFFQNGMLLYYSERDVLKLTERGMELGNLIFEIFVTV